MRILVISQFFPPESAAAAKRADSIVSALGNLGHAVDVLTLLPNYPTGEVYPAYRTLAQDSQQGKVRIRRLTPVATPPDQLFRRMVAELRFCAWAFRRALGNDYDLLVVTSPSMFLLPTALLVSILRGQPWLSDLRDLTWLYLAHVKGGRLKPLSRMLEHVMLYCLKHPSNVATLSATPGITTYLEQRGLEPGRTKTCLNGISRGLLEQFDFGVKRAPGPEKCITFVGNLGYNYDLETLVRVAELRPDYHVRIVGDGPQRARLAALGQSVTNVTLVGHLSGAELVKEFERADLFYCGLIATEVLANTALPVKVFEYMAAGRPYVYRGEGLIERFVATYPAGVVVSAREPHVLAQHFDALLSDTERYAQMAALGRRAAQTFERETLMQTSLAAVLGELSGQMPV